MNNHENKRDVKSKEYNDKGHKGHTSKRLKTETNNQENDELENIFYISKFYDNELTK
ncbi:hypothetical protein U3516DRAFT_735776 [Neocallimastix sp. 'constans']